MIRRKFLILYESLKERISKEGKKSPEWFLGYVEGFGNQKLTGYQIGALYYLMVLPENKVPEDTEEVKENDSISIPGVL